jgi:hypothetical protein
MNANDKDWEFENKLLNVLEAEDDAEEQRDRNAHYLLTAWKELLESRSKEKANPAHRVTRART